MQDTGWKGHLWLLLSVWGFSMGYRRYFFYLIYVVLIVGVVHIGILERGQSGSSSIDDRLIHYGVPVAGQDGEAPYGFAADSVLPVTDTVDAIKNSTISPMMVNGRSKDSISMDHFRYWTINATGFTKVHAQLYYYSAFLDERVESDPYLRIIIMSNFRPKDMKINCEIDNSIIEGQFYEFCENHGLRIRGYFISCKVPKSASLRGAKLDALLRSSREPRKWIPIAPINVVPATNFAKPLFSLSLCVPVVFGNHYTVEDLIAFFELNKILGIDHVFLYLNTRSLSKGILRLLFFYESAGYVTLLNWDVHTSGPDDIWNYGQILSVQDCLYRNMGVSRFLAFHDVDEHIIPQADDVPLATMLEKSWINSSLAGFGILTAYFAQNPRSGKPIALQNVQRSTKLDAVLTKCIVKPEAIFEMGIHHISRVLEGYWVQRLDAKIAILYHYKDCMNARRVRQCRGSSARNDLVPRRYGKRLLDRIKIINNLLKKVT